MSYRTITLKFGLLNVVVGLDSAISKPESLKNVCEGLEGHEHITTALKQPKLKCPHIDPTTGEACGTEEGEYTKKAQVVGKGFLVVGTDVVTVAKLDASEPTKKHATLLHHPAGEVDTATIISGGAYYLTASGPGWVEPLAILTDTVRRHPEYAYTCQFAPAGRVNMYRLGLFGDTLVLQELCRTEDLKVLQQPVLTINPINAAQMDTLVKQDAVPYEAATYQDTYRAKLDEIFAATTLVPGADVVADQWGAVPPGVLDLTALLASGIKPTPKVRKPRAKKAKVA